MDSVITESNKIRLFREPLAWRKRPRTGSCIKWCVLSSTGHFSSTQEGKAELRVRKRKAACIN